MLLDWFTVVAQIINFLVLVGLLKYFLYGPIIRAMDQREAKIASRLEEAAQKEQEAEQELESYQRKNQELEEQRGKMLAQAQEEAEARRKELMLRARTEVEQTRTRWLKAIQREKAAFLQELRHQAGRQVYDIARRALADLARADLEKQIVQVFLERLRKLDPEQRQALVQSLQPDKGVLVTSAFEVSEKTRRNINQIIKGFSKDTITVQYQTAPEVILGIELKTPSHKIAWSLENYLESLEAHLQETLEAKVRAEAAEKDEETEGTHHGRIRRRA